METPATPFVREKHAAYLVGLDKTLDSDAIGHYTNEHLKLPGAYWCIGSLKLLNKLSEERKQEIAAFIKACQHECGGFGGNVGHDPHVVTTLYSLLVLAMFDQVDAIDQEKMAQFIASHQNDDGSFKGDSIKYLHASKEREQGDWHPTHQYPYFIQPFTSKSSDFNIQINSLVNPTKNREDRARLTSREGPAEDKDDGKDIEDEEDGQKGWNEEPYAGV